MRLQVLNAMGRSGEVRDEVKRMRRLLRKLPREIGQNEAMPPWNVRETLLDTDRAAARLLRQWKDALRLNAEQVASMRARHAAVDIIARARYNDYKPLLKLGRTRQALNVLTQCREILQDGRDFAFLGKTLSALAQVEHERGHGDVAIRLDTMRCAQLPGEGCRRHRGELPESRRLPRVAQPSPGRGPCLSPVCFP